MNWFGVFLLVLLLYSTCFTYCLCFNPWGIMHHKGYVVLCGKLTCDPLLSSFDWFGSSSSFFFMLTWRYLLCLHVVDYECDPLLSSFRFGSSSSFFFMLTWRYLLCRHASEISFRSSSFFFLLHYCWWVCRFEKSYCICVEMSFTYPKCLRYPDFAPRVLRGASFRLLIFHQESCGSFPGVACTL